MTYLKHYGLRGMSWGSRRFRGYDGKLTPAGKERYYSWDRKQITNQIPDGTFAYNEVDDEVYESVGGRMVAIDHNRPDYEERKAEARRAYETQKEIEEHFKHAYLGWGIYGIVDDRTYLAHHGVKGMKWGIRRYQPYPDGVNGKFIGRRKLQRSLNKLDKSRLKNTYYSNKYSKNISKLSSKNASGKYDKKIAKFSTKKASYDQAIKAGNDLTTKLMDQASAQGMSVETAVKRRSFLTGRDIAIRVLSLGTVIAWHEGFGYKYKVKPAKSISSTTKDANSSSKLDLEYEKELKIKDDAINEQLARLEKTNPRVLEIAKNHTGDGYEYTMKVLNTTNDKKLSDAIKDYDDTYSKQESDRKAIAKAGGADSESTFKRMTQDPKNRSLGDRLEEASEDAEWAVERNDYSSAEERERAVRQARERQQSAYDELIKYERDTYGFSYVDYNRARGH